MDRVQCYRVCLLPLMLFETDREAKNSSTALFISPFPSSSHHSGIAHFDFAKPVLNFVLDGDGLFWVLLDGEWGDDSSKDMVKLLQWDSGTEKVRLPPHLQNRTDIILHTQFETLDPKSIPPLLTSLNTQSLLPATPSSLTQLELYSSLSSMPKSSADDPEAAALASSRGTKRKQAGSDAAASKRQEGRLRKKMALKKALEAKGDGGSEEKRIKSLEEGDVAMSES